jgi:hypothetical protein
MARSRRLSCLILRMVAAILVYPAWRMSPVPMMAGTAEAGPLVLLLC